MFHVVTQGYVFVKCTGIYSSIVWLIVVIFQFSGILLSYIFEWLITYPKRSCYSSSVIIVLHYKSMEGKWLMLWWSRKSNHCDCSVNSSATRYSADCSAYRVVTLLIWMPFGVKVWKKKVPETTVAVKWLTILSYVIFNVDISQVSLL